MKKWAFGIIVFMSVIFLLGISKVNALAFNLPPESSYEQARHLWDDSWSATLGNENFNQLCFYVGNSDDTIGNIFCVFGGWPMQLSTNSNYINELNPNGYYFYRQYRFSNNQNYDPNYIMKYNGTSWSVVCGSGITSWCSPSSYINYTNRNKVFITYYRQYATSSNTDGTKSASPVDSQLYNISEYTSIYYYINLVEALPNIVYNISVDDSGVMSLDYYFDTPDYTNINLILCLRYDVPAGEGFTCTRNFTNYVTHQFTPIHPENTYYISYENLDTGEIIKQIELNVEQYINSLPDIEKTDIIAKYTYYNQDYLTDSPQALTNLLNVLNAPIQVITEIVLYIWNSFNVYIKLFLIGMFSALIMSALIKYIK